MDEHDFGRLLRELRHQRQETLEEVSDATGLSVAMLSRVERGQRLPSPQSVEALADHFGIPADELMSETIAHKMMNRYGREWSSQAAERIRVSGTALEGGPSGQVARSANPAPENSEGEFADSRSAEFADLRTARRETSPSAVARPAHPRSQSRGPELLTSDVSDAARAPLPMRHAGAAFSAQPIEALFGEAAAREAAESARDSLADAARVAEVALQSTIRAVERAMASGDPDRIEEAEQVLERLREMLE